MTPHLAEELWQRSATTTLLADAPLARSPRRRCWSTTRVTIAVQVNGKLRGTVQLAKDAAKDVAEKAALALPEIVRGARRPAPKRVIVVPNRIVNVVL